MQIEPLALVAELVDDTGETVAHGLVTLSPTPGEIEIKGNDLPRLNVGATIGVIVHTQNAILTSLVGSVSFYGRGIVGICDVEKAGLDKLNHLLLQNVAIKTYATRSARLFKQGEDYDISIIRLGIEECCFTSIENIDMKSELTINNNSLPALKKYTVIVEEVYHLHNMVKLYIARPIKNNRANLTQINYLLGKK